MSTLSIANGGAHRRRVVAVTGASGFVGRHLIWALSKIDDIEVRMLTRSKYSQLGQSAGVVTVVGDLADQNSLSRLLVRGCTVINLAYSYTCSEELNLSYASNLAEVCAHSRVDRVIHCSTASVFGTTSGSLVDESMPCHPRNSYGITKLKIEEIYKNFARDKYLLYVLRPTSVFGEGGLSLSKMIDEIMLDGIIKRYLRECLYGARRLNLLSVDTLVRAVIFLAKTDAVECGAYIVSQDDWEENNYAYLTELAYAKLGKKRGFSRVQISRRMLEALLSVRGRDVTDTSRHFSSARLARAGFQNDEDFCGKLNQFVSNYVAKACR
jgi:nucleoside-diphosphate-sugar epimerase